MFHINSSDEAKPCKAKTPEACRFYLGPEDSRHYENAQEAAAASEALLKAAHGPTHQEVRYSFQKAFQEREQAFKKRYEGLPTRFFSYDLRGKLLKAEANLTELALAYSQTSLGSLRAPELFDRLTQAASSPKDNQASDEEVEVALQELGLTSVKQQEAGVIGRRTSRAWVGEFGETTVVVTDDPAYSSFNIYHFSRFTPRGFTGAHDRFTVVTPRSLMGARRIAPLVGGDLTPLFLQGPTIGDERAKQRVAAVLALDALEQEQEAGGNFLLQRKRFKEQQKVIATAWMDKKNPDQLHRGLMESHELKDHFRKVELDNDVDPAEWQSFQQEVLAVQEKLPTIPGDRQPELRVRKLGKHRALGLYFPHKNTVCVDLRTSEAYIHEMGHYYDIAVQENASLSEDFQEVAKRYRKHLQNVPQGKEEYYSTPTEIFARGFELYAHERLGITHSRLMRPESFDNFDYKPFTAHPEEKARLFAVLDKVFQKA